MQPQSKQIQTPGMKNFITPSYVLNSITVIFLQGYVLNKEKETEKDVNVW